ncbi:MAG: bifunctional 2-C-methyl-D-erythritol 4-phosphate cytidylyltransferase/2-C-methyl-D-erythritol 2,4-cyclodiphosphate synthase [Pseudomonadota bacterium]
MKGEEGDVAQSGYTAIIVAAGRGERAGGSTPKQLRVLAGKPVLAWSAERFARDAACRQLIIVTAPELADSVTSCLQTLSVEAMLVNGGATRGASVRAGLDAATEDRVLIHDAARPLLSATLIDRLLAGLEHADGAAPALPVADALVSLSDTVTPVDRTPLRRVQTPQAFHTQVLRRAFGQSGWDAFPDEVSLARTHGLDVVLVEGEERNFKLTWPDDFARAEALINRTGPMAMTITGQGYDVHRLAPGDGLMLCGIRIDCPLRLVGHSDADAGLHALTDAVLGAAGAGDIGQHFPPSDPQWAGASSDRFLLHALKLADEAGVTPLHADITLICERPKIGPNRDAMRARIAELLGLELQRVNIKATTTEGLGFTGRGEGLAAQAVFTGRLEPRDG